MSSKITRTCFEKSNERRRYANRLIPGGSHTYSKGDDQFPRLSPHSIVRGSGARIWDVDGNEFIDWGMGLSSVILGHAFGPVIEAVREELGNGNGFIRPSYLEAELAQMVCDQVPCAEMVKFAKNGSDAVSAAVRLARAYTGRDLILRCGDQPFFSIHDWFIGDTAIDTGVPETVKSLTKRFKYNDLVEFERVVAEHRSAGIACAILQPADTVAPGPGYLAGLKKICEREGIILIFDEVVTGFRWHPKGAQHLYGVTPHLATFGKAMANGFSISALVGKRELMEMGGLEQQSRARVFLMSTTYGGETHHLRAAMKTIEVLNQDDYAATRKIWATGAQMKANFNAIATRLGIQARAAVSGVDCKPVFNFKDAAGAPDPALRTLFLQEVIKHGAIVQNILPSFSHGEIEIQETTEAFAEALQVVAQAIEAGSVERFLVGPAVKAVFRKYN